MRIGVIRFSLYNSKNISVPVQTFLLKADGFDGKMNVMLEIFLLAWHCLLRDDFYGITEFIEW